MPRSVLQLRRGDGLTMPFFLPFRRPRSFALFLPKTTAATVAAIITSVAPETTPVQTWPEQCRLGRALLSSTDARDPRHGASIHAITAKLPPHWSSSFSLWNKLLNLYARCGLFRNLYQLFDEMPERDSVSYNTVLSACLRDRERYSMSKGLNLYAQMLEERVVPNHITLSVLLGAVPSSKVFLSVVGQIHAHAVKLMLGSSEFVGGSLVSGYTKFGMLELAVRAFEEIDELDTVSWNIMIDACARCGSTEHAVRVFSRMCWEHGGGVGFDYFTLTSVTKTCLEPKDVGLGMQLHACALKAGLDSDTPVGNALVTMYSKCEEGMESASKVFWAIRDQDIISWTALISGFMQTGLDEEAFQFYITMLRSGLVENEFSFASVLPAIGGLVSIENGRQIHARITKSVFGLDIGVGNALIDMYFKCGSLEDAKLAFDTMSVHDGVSWTMLIAGFGQHGMGREAVETFRVMGGRGFQPDSISFLSVLAACSHGGLVEEGLQIFHSMVSIYDIKPSRKHYACVVDMLGRSGKLKEAEAFIRQMGLETDPLAWEALLGACGMHGEMEIGKISAEKIMELEPHKDGPYVMLANLYAERRMWEAKGEARWKLDVSGLKKEVACSWSIALT